MAPRPAWIPIILMLFVLFMPLRIMDAAQATTTTSANTAATTNIVDLVNLPEWKPFYESLRTTASLQDLLDLSSFQPNDRKFELPMNGRSETRSLQEWPSSSLSSSALASNGIPCNQVLDSISLEDLQSTLTYIVDAIFMANGAGGGEGSGGTSSTNSSGSATTGSLQNTFFKSLLIDRLQTGLQVVQVCGSCADSIPTSQLETHLDYCGPSIYGNNLTYSGLLLIPTVETTSNDANAQEEVVGGDNNGDSSSTNSNNNNNNTHSIIRPGTHPGFIYLPSTRISLTETPSLLWKGRQDTEPIVWLFMAMASSQGIPWLSPFTMGYGNATDTATNNTSTTTTTSSSYKAYIIRKGYETAIVPLWYQAQTLIRKWSGGCAALGNAAMIAGYSEGGYSSIVVAHALRRNAGVDIWKVQSGAGPYKVSSKALWGIWKMLHQATDISTNNDGNGNSNSNDDDVILYGIVALLGVSYSSTYPHLANYMTSQDLLRSDNGTRDILVDLLTGPEQIETSDELVKQIKELLLQLPPSVGGSSSNNNLFDLLNPALVDAAEQYFTSDNNSVTDLCIAIPVETLQELEIDLLCAALAQNDLTTVLETEVDYPVEFCQSPDDEIVLESNLPNLTSNPEFLTRVSGVAGNHITAGETCFLMVLQQAILSATNLGTPYAMSIEPLHDTEGGHCTFTSSGTATTLPPNTDPEASSSSSTTLAAWTLLLPLFLLLKIRHGRTF